MDVVISTLKNQIPKVYTKSPANKKEKQKAKKKRREMEFKKEKTHTFMCKLISTPIQKSTSVSGDNKKMIHKNRRLGIKLKNKVSIIKTMIKGL